MPADNPDTSVEVLPSKALPQISLKLFLLLIAACAVALWLVNVALANRDSVWLRSLLMVIVTTALCFTFYAVVYAAAWIITLPSSKISKLQSK